MKSLSVTLMAVSLLLLSACHDMTQNTRNLSSERMTDGTVLEVTPSGDVKIGAQASLIVTANDGMVYIKGPFAVGDDLVVRDGKVHIKNLKELNASAEKIQKLENRIRELESRLIALEGRAKMPQRLALENGEDKAE
ncbi:MAG: hypothetical protein CMN76_02310 [Spirochaetaceae bacterium]|nr:hypothetical protein [Spirochaetaceae bacterium]|tara:strand:- start:41342 stop:41752 length:411 start_codon:yes stop_codon:yes gene_type:complete